MAQQDDDKRTGDETEPPHDGGSGQILGSNTGSIPEGQERMLGSGSDDRRVDKVCKDGNSDWSSVASRDVHTNDRGTGRRLDTLSTVSSGTVNLTSNSQSDVPTETEKAIEPILEKCPTCGRDECEKQNGEICTLVTNQNSLVAALRLIVKTKFDRDAVKTALIVLDSIAGSSHRCPVCEATGVVRNNTVNVHFTKPTDDKPCQASYKTVLGGILWDGKVR